MSSYLTLNGQNLVALMATRFPLTRFVYEICSLSVCRDGLMSSYLTQ
jgi:hypothetical protein